MAKLTHLMIHCSATREGQWFEGKHIIAWHTDPAPKGRGWSRPGYADLILLDGRVENLFPYNADDHVETWEITNGASGWNNRTRHICYIGGAEKEDHTVPKDTRTEGQLIAMETYVKLTLRLQPWLKLIGHNQVAQKACPSFDVRKWAKEIGIQEENIDQNNYVNNGFIGN